MSADNRNNDDNRERRFDLLAMLAEIESDKKVPARKIAEQAEISDLFKKNRERTRPGKND